MKSGRSLQDIAKELERQTATRKDYVAPQGAVAVAVVENNEVRVKGLGGNDVALAIKPHAHKQLSDNLNIPKKYYDRMLVERPALLADNINGWFQQDAQNSRMFRTLDGDVRAFLSAKYRPLDNYDLANAVLPTLLQHNVQVMSAELTETRFYIKGILPSLSSELPEGMTWGHGHHNVGRDGRIVAAIVISNSDVGAGALRVEPSVFTTWCTNLAIMKQAAMRKYHVGRSHGLSEVDDAHYELMRDDTRKADDRAFWLKVRDITMSAFDGDKFKAALKQIADAGKTPIVSTELPAVVEVAVKRLALPDSSASSILTHLAKGGDLTKWGLSSAITATANDAHDYEDATALERAGGEVLAFTEGEWKPISNASAAA